METKEKTGETVPDEIPTNEVVSDDAAAEQVSANEATINEATINEATINEASESTASDSISSEKSATEVVIDKPNTNREMIAYLAEKFPKCFLIKGAAKPLKIGIFQELAKQLADDDKISKTRLRQVLRHYTSSWRYLKAIKVGNHRVNLQGESVEEIDQAQADYASKTLKESQEKFAGKTTHKRAQDNKTNKSRQGIKSESKRSDNKSGDKKLAENKHKAKFNAVKSTKNVKKRPAVKLEKISQLNVRVGQQVKVQLGNTPMDAIVKEVAGNDICVELASGMVVKTPLENLYQMSTQ